MNLSIPRDIHSPVCNLLEAELNMPVTLVSFTFMGGGSVNQGGRIKTSIGDFFLKWNDAQKYPGMFAVEARGLNQLRKSETIKTPKVIGTEVCDNHQFILLEFVEGRPASKNFWLNLGKALAHLHTKASPAYGLDHDNYIGSLHQSNTEFSSWIDFYITMRLRPQMLLAINSNKFDKDIVQKFEKLFSKLSDLLPDDWPALLHGDLWSGNLLTDEKGEPCLIDPAIYFGHREVEIAFTKLFGGFDHSFYEAYQYELPLANNFQERVELYQLYPLLVHVNLFGGGYISQVKRILNKFC